MNRVPRRRSSIFSRTTRKGSFWGSKKTPSVSIAQLLNEKDQEPTRHVSASPSFEPGINNLKSFKLAPLDNTTDQDSDRIESTPTTKPLRLDENPAPATSWKLKRSTHHRTSISSIDERSVVSPPNDNDHPVPGRLRRSSLGVLDNSAQQHKLGRNAKSHEGTFGVPQSLREKYNQAVLAASNNCRRGSTGNDSVFSDSSLNDTINSLSLASPTTSSPISPLKRHRHHVNNNNHTQNSSKRRNSHSNKQCSLGPSSSPVPVSPNYWLSQQARIALQENSRLNKVNSRLITKLDAAYEELLRVEALPKELLRLKAEKLAQHEQLVQQLQALEAQNELLQNANTQQ